MRPVVTIGEWEQQFVPCELTPHDRASLKAWSDHRIAVLELRNGIQIESTSWVGVVRLEGLDIRVFPKLPGGASHLVRMIELASGLKGLSDTIGAWDLAPSGDNLIDLLARLLANEADRLVRLGLLSNYVEDEAALVAVRGRILADRQILRRFGALDRIWCRYDEYSQDCPENRLVAHGLARAVRLVGDGDLRLRLRRILEVYEEVLDLDRAAPSTPIQAISYDRLNEHYRNAHVLAALLIQGSGVDDLYGPGPIGAFAFALNMNTIFESFMTRWLSDLLRPEALRVDRQVSTTSVIRRFPSDTPYGTVRPDILVRRSEGLQPVVPIDIKYKRYDLKGKVSNPDLYQMFLYAFAFSHPRSGLPKSGLFYPVDGDELSVDRLRVGGVSGAACLDIVGVPIPALMAELEAGVPGRLSTEVRRQIAGWCNGISI